MIVKQTNKNIKPQNTPNITTTKDPTANAPKIKVPHTVIINNNIPSSTIVFNTDEAKLPQ